MFDGSETPEFLYHKVCCTTYINYMNNKSINKAIVC